jgi:hypothetical protein
MLKLFISIFIVNLINREAVADIFYPFGVLNQDIKAPKVDEANIGPIRFNYITSFQYFYNEYSSLYINPNGLISFDSNTLGFYGTDFSYPNSIFTAIAPFWSDIDTRQCGDIYYRETTNLNTLSLISNDLNFRATWAFIVTYDRVCKYGPPYDGLTNSFQIVLHPMLTLLIRFIIMVNYHGTKIEVMHYILQEMESDIQSYLGL